MNVPVETLRILLTFCLVGLAILAVLYLRGRRLSLAAYLCWGLAALILPGLGPLLVMAFHPGRSRPKEIHA